MFLTLFLYPIKPMEVIGYVTVILLNYTKAVYFERLYIVRVCGRAYRHKCRKNYIRHTKSPQDPAKTFQRTLYVDTDD